jgi:TetR/AcrR family fatty acid metabolism transcriptional regulator
MTRKRTNDKRQRILDAAVRVFSKKGFFASRVSDVAAAARVADGTVYLYFRNKDDILVNLFDDVMSEHLAAAREAISKAADTPGRLRIIADHHLGLLGGNPELAVVFQVELRQSTKFMELFTASWLKDYFDIVEKAMEAGQRDGSVRKDLPRRLAAHAFFGSLDALVTSWVLSRNAFNLAELAGPMVELFLTGAATPGAATQGAATQVRSVNASRTGRPPLRAVALNAAPLVARAGRKAR